MRVVTAALATDPWQNNLGNLLVTARTQTGEIQRIAVLHSYVDRYVQRIAVPSKGDTKRRHHTRNTRAIASKSTAFTDENNLRSPHGYSRTKRQHPTILVRKY